MKMIYSKLFGRSSLPIFTLLLVGAAVSHANAAEFYGAAKPGISAMVNHKPSSVATVGRLYPVVLDFTHVGARGATVSFTTDPELKLQGTLPDTVPPGDSSVTVNVLPNANGRTFLNVFLKQDGSSRAMSIPVQVGTGGPHMQPPADLKPGNGGKLINRMQAH